MKNSKTILHESLGKKMLEQSIQLPYVVPEGYFDSLTTTMLQQLPKEEVQLPIVSTPDYATPEGYFDGLSNGVLSRVASLSRESGDELAAITPVGHDVF
jgi:hypothetical protein